MRRRVAKQALDVGVALPIVERCSQLDGVNLSEAETMFRDGRRFYRAMLDHAHKEGSGGDLPSNTHLSRWQHAANVLAYAVWVGDPEWMREYALGLTGQQQAMVSSMITNGRLRSQET